MDVTGVDISETAVRNLKIKFPHVTFIQGTIENITGRYDVIVMMDVLFHILDDNDYRETLMRISSCMSSGSTFIFTENFSDERIDKRHHISRGRRFIEEAVTNAGLEIILRRPFFCIMNQPIRKNAGETLWWKVVVSFLIRFPAAGWVLGAILYPLEATLLYFGVGASTDIVVCKRKTSIAL
jgi:predicted TPR repeat methyltransferase